MFRTRSLFANLSIAVILTVLSGCSLLPKEEIDEPPPLKAPPETRTVIYTAKRDYIAKEIRGLGRAASTQEKSLYFRISGRLRKVYIDYGTEVKKGDPLMELEMGDLEYQLKVAKIDLNQAEIRLQKAKKTLGLEGGTNQYDYKSIQLDRDKAKAQVDELQGKIDNSTLKAPFDGRVVEIKAKEGDYIQDYSTMLTVANPNKVEIQVEVDSNQLSEIAPKMKCKVAISQDEWIEGSVRQVATPGSELSPGVPDRRVMIKLKPEDINRLIYNDPYQVIIITLEDPNALVVPNSTIRDYMGRKFVRVVSGDSRREADVEVGIEGTINTQILKGIEEGDQVMGK